MSVPYLKDSAAAHAIAKLVCLIRLQLGDGEELVGKDETEHSWTEAVRILLLNGEPDRDFIERVIGKDEATLALLFFHLHLYFARKSHL